ncbi:MAG: M20/M25/M40 family metallo-hydrolase, partial [Sphingobacteriales bacterium]
QLRNWGLINVKREPWGKFGKGWEVQKNYAAITIPYYHPIISVPKAWTPGTNGPFKGEVMILKIDSAADLDKYKGKLQGKAIMLDVDNKLSPSFHADAARYTDTALVLMSKVIARPQFMKPMPMPMELMAVFQKMFFKQSLGSFFKAEGAGLVLSIAHGTDGTVFTSNGASYDDSAALVAPELETSGEDYLRILRLVKSGQKVEIEADIKTQFFTDDMQGYNVVAEIPGKDKKLKEQLVMLGGHLDSWHGATGATDNAAGCAVVMEAVRILKAINFKPKRTIRIVLWSGEEQGMIGSRNYVRKHFGDAKTLVIKPGQAKVSAYYNLDNGTGKIRGIWLQKNNDARPIFQAWLNPFKDLGASTVAIENTGATDHISLDAVGIPAFQFIQDPVDYGSRTHHTNQDTYDRLVEDDLKQAATIMASFVYHTAQRKEMIPRKEMPKETGMVAY